MKIELNSNFITIAQAILKEEKTQEEWAEIESGDMFQEGEYSGGFDATEEEFCFSYYEEEKEYWFQIPLEKMSEVVEMKLQSIEAVEADF